MPLATATIQMLLSAAESVTNAGGSSDTHGSSLQKYLTLLNGTGAGNAQKVGDKIFATTTSILNVDLSAFAGGIANANINFSVIRWFAIENLDAVNAVTVTFSGTNGWTNAYNGVFTLNPGEIRFFADNGTGKVVDSTHKIVGLTAVAGTPQVQIRVVGEGT